MEQEILKAMDVLLAMLQADKGSERSDRARCVAVTITEMEKAKAYYALFVANTSRLNAEA